MHGCGDPLGSILADLAIEEAVGGNEKAALDGNDAGWRSEG